MTRDCKGKLAYLCKLLTKKRSRCAKRDQKLLYLSSEKLLLMLYYPIMHSGKEVVTSGAQTSFISARFLFNRRMPFARYNLSISRRDWVKLLRQYGNLCLVKSSVCTKIQLSYPFPNIDLFTMRQLTTPVKMKLQVKHSSKIEYGGILWWIRICWSWNGL